MPERERIKSILEKCSGKVFTSDGTDPETLKELICLIKDSPESIENIEFTFKNSGIKEACELISAIGNNSELSSAAEVSVKIDMSSLFDKSSEVSEQKSNQNDDE